MSFGRKGLAPGEAASVPGAGFGRAGVRACAAPSAQSVTQDDMAAKRAAFIASERARDAAISATSKQDVPDDPLINLRNRSAAEPSFMQGAARAAQPLGEGMSTGSNMGPGYNSAPMRGSGQLSAQQEKEIRQAARAMAGAGRSYSGGSVRQSGSRPTSYFFGDPAGRNLGIAYLLWFVLGQFSLHRFYCGHKDSAIFQVALWMASLVMLLIFLPLGILGFAVWVCWIFGDLFMIPGMLRKFQAEHDYRGVFA